MRRGFTLIELLAVIVILAIISLIAVPIVLNIIDDSKKSSTIRSAEMYLNAVEYSLANSVLNNNRIANGVYSITQEGNLCLENRTRNLCTEENTLLVEVKGEKPTGGFITIENGSIMDISLTLSEKIVVKNSNGELVYQTKELEKEKTLDTVCTYLNNGVSEKTAGAKYSCEVKDGTSYNFYVLTTPLSEDDSINLIMERNICVDGIVATEENKCTVAWNTGVWDNQNGPITAMNYLNEVTNSWTNIQNINITYDDEGGHFTEFALNGKARLPYKKEISEYNTVNSYLYDYLSGTQSVNKINLIDGYWILSSFSDSTDSAWYVGSFGNSLYSDVVPRDDAYGVRPVINLKL